MVSDGAVFIACEVLSERWHQSKNFQIIQNILLKKNKGSRGLLIPKSPTFPQQNNLTILGILVKEVTNIDKEERKKLVSS